MTPKLRLLSLLLAVIAFGPPRLAQAQSAPCASPGKDGTTFSAAPNTYYPGVGTAGANATTLTIGAIRTGTGASNTPITAGDLLLVIQMQGADINSTNSDSYGDGVAGGGASGNLTTNLTAGQYEYVTVSSVAGSTITLTTGLKNTYVTAALNGTNTLRTFQVVRVPQYSDLALTANIVPPFWNGSTGGIIALDVQGQLNFGTATINAAGLGFRGGAGVRQLYNSANAVTQYVTTGPANLTAATTNLNAQKGEGIAGTPRFVNVLGATTATNTGIEGYPGGTSSRGAPGNAGGGGNDNGNNSGGGGGGNAGPGGRGGLTSNNLAYGGEPGATFASSPSVLIMGGGGGAGTTNDGSGNTALDGFASSGAPGGGIVIVRTGTVSGSGGIVVDGADAPSGVRNDGAGGGGAGGSILLTAATSQAGLANLTLSAKGGAGGTTRPVDAGNSSTGHGPGGGGGGGVIFSSGATQTSLVASTTGGAAGTSTPGGTTATSPTSTFGAANGSNASAANGSTSTSNTIANSSAGAVCAPIVVNVSPVCANAGKDGATFSATPNTYYPGTGTAAANATTLTVGAIRTGTGAGATLIGIGDLLLVIQMQGADINNTNSASYGSTTNVTAGQYEYVVVSGVSGSTITFTTGLKNGYTTSAANAVPIRTFQVVRVPQYSSLTLTNNIVPAAWNGSTGGIVALDVAGAINLNGFAINVSGLGFRGGAGRVLTSNNFDDAAYLTTSASGFNGQKGEGLAGTPQYVNSGNMLLNTNVDGYSGGSASRGAPGNAGGGGNDNNNNSGGGGGANGGRGGRGGNNFLNNNPIGGEPGATFAASGTSLVLGGGGGAGSTNNGTGGGSSAGIASSGSAGGGIIIVRAGSVAGTGSALANAAAVLTGVVNDGGGGGGAGGSILITATTPSGLSGLTLSANGAAGGNTNPASVNQSQHGPGGGGGGGIIFTNGAVASATTNGGATGQTTYTAANNTTATAPYGAAAGAAGVVSTNTSIASTGGTSGASCTSITGTIFDDSNYGGGSGRSLSTATSSASGLANIGSAGTTVELYTSTGGFVATTTTAANGTYSFAGLTAGAGYVVRVVNSTVKSARTPGATGLVPVQTFRTTSYTGTAIGAATPDPNRVGGEAPEKQDAAANSGSQALAALTTGTATPQSITTILAGTTSVDFGYNFDVVVNTNDTGQGSLRQFITNSNALGDENLLAQAGSRVDVSGATQPLPTGTETSIFMIPSGAAVAGQLAGLPSGLNANGVAAITPASQLPTISSSNTSLDATTQTFNIGNTNTQVLGTGGTVGTTAAALNQLNGPEVQIKGTTNVNGITIATNTNNTIVRGVSIYGFATNIYGGIDDTGTRIEQNVIGASATSFTDPGAGNRTLNEGINLNGSDNGVVTNNLIGFNGGMGLWVASSNGSGANNNTISGNEIRGNAITTIAGAGERLVFDGLELQGNSTGNTVSGNLIAANYGHGIDSFDNGIGGNTVLGNTISGNGVGVATGTGEEGSGLRVFGATNPTLISGNVLSGNNGSGVLVIGSANQVTISQNSTFGNTRLGIDLISDTGAPGFWNGYTGTTSNVTVNDNGDSDTGGNGLLNFPVITSATVANGNLVVRGFARPGSVIELFTPSSTPNGVAANAGFGQGQTYLGTFTEGSAADTDNGTGSYGPGTINGLSQGSDNTNRFSFTIPLTGNFAGYAAGSQLTSTATLNNSTSEFSGNARVNLAPTANNVTNVAVLTNSATAVLNPNLSATPNSAGVTIASYTITDLSNINGTLTYNGTVLTSANIASTLITDLSKLTYKPTSGFSGNATFSYLATDSNGITSNTATYTIPVSPVADVVAAFQSGTPTTITAGGPLNLNVNFTNIGPNDAAGVTRSVQLPAGLGTVTVSNGGTYSNTTGLVTFSPSPTTLTTTGNLNTTISIQSVPVGMSSITAVATIATTTSEGGATANNTAATTVAVVPSFDLATTISGPASFAAGTLATYTVTTKNNGLSAIGTPGEAANGAIAAIPATGAVQTVQLPTGLSGVFATNGGTYDSNSGLVTFPDVALANGQVVTNTISFSVAAASSFNVAATVAKTSTLAGTDTQSGNNTASTPTSATAPSATTTNLYVTASGPAQVTGGSVASYTIMQGNYGPNAASNVQTQVSLPTGLTGSTLTLTTNGTAATAGTPTGGVITFSDGSKYTQATGVLVLPALTTQNSAATPQTYVVGVTAPSTTTNPAMNITASVGATTSDIMPANNVATVETEIQPLTDVVIALTNLSTNSSGAALGGSNLLAGQTASYEIQATNSSTNPARNVQRSVALPSSLDPTTLLLNGAAGTLSNGVVTYSNGATYTVSTGTLTLPTIADLMGGAVQTTLLSFTVPAPNSSGIIKLPVAATISTSTPESSTGNNAASLVNNLASAQDVAVSLSGPTQAVVGNPVLYTVSTTNNGPSANGTQTTTVTLPTALDPTTLLINNAAATSASGGVYNFAGGITYTASTGVVAYPATGLSLPKTGQSAVSTIQFVAPNATLLNAVANVSGVSNDFNSTNNSATVITPLSTSSLASLDLSTTIAASVANGPVGTSDTFTVTTVNGSSTTAATSVTQTLVLPAGLTNNGGTVTTTNGGVYNNQTGVVTFTVGNLAASASVQNSATISLPASPVGSANPSYVLTAMGSSFTANPETNVTNNTATTNVTVGSKYDLAANISGPAAAPAGSTVNYTVGLTNAGPSSATGVTGTFTLPAGVTSFTATSPTGVATPYTGASGSAVTFRPAANLLTGQSEQWQISFTAPANTFTATANIAATGPVAETSVLPNTASTTTIVNQGPVAYDVVSKVNLPLGNTANAMPLTPLNAFDPEGGPIAKYTIASLPSANAGTLYYNGAAAVVGTVVTDPAALTFKPLSTFVGNAFFTYTATDNGNGTAASALTSAPARYTIPVGQDNSSVATASTQTKGGATPYATGDVLAYIVDANGAQYTANSGTTPGIVYNAATGVLQSGAANGLASASLVAGAGPAGNTANTLPAGVSLNPVTGQVYVSDASQLVNNPTARTYSVNVTTVDVNGGINTTPVTFTLGAYPLPVELVAFTAQAVQNRDALLKWTTASELNNDHFEVERSLDGTTFTKIGQQQGQGSKATATDYTFTDAGIGARTTAGQLVYYRLKQVDLNGASVYSPVRSVSFTAASTALVTLYPNPAAAATSLDLSAMPAGNTYQVLLLDATGRQVRQATVVGGLVQPLDLHDLATGTYQVLVSGQQGGASFRQVLRLIKE